MISTQKGLTAWLAMKRRRSATPALGARELVVLEILWRETDLSAQQILERMPEHDDVGLNTIQSTIERLSRKDIVARKKVGRQYLYRPQLSKTDMISRLLHDIATDVAGGEMAPMISGFMHFMAEECATTESRLDPQWRKLLEAARGPDAENKGECGDG